jgi:hypothetical protein
MSRSKPPSPPPTHAGGYCRPPADKQFKPGQSGNPTGRPAIVKRIRELCQERGPAAIEELWRMSFDPAEPGPVRKACLTEILDRGFGKPTVGTPDDEGGQRQVMEIITGIVRGKAE